MLSIDDVPFPGPSAWVEGLVEGRRGTLVHEKRERSVWRVEEDGRVWFAKRGGRGKVREIAREARWIERLSRAGVPTAKLLAAGPHAGGYWIVTAPAGGRSLGTLLEEALRAEDHARVRRLAEAAGRLARTLHGEDFRFPDLTASHVFVNEASEPHTATLIDVARAAAPMGGVGPGARAEDLAALLFSLPFDVGRVVRARLLRVATGWRGDELRGLTRRLDAAVRHLASRTRWRHEFVGATNDVRRAVAALHGGSAAADVSSVDVDSAEVDSAEVDSVESDSAESNSAAANELEAESVPGLFDALMDGAGMEIVRTLADRENRRFPGADGGTYFMKTYPPVADGFSPAMQEWRGIDRLARAGIPVCRAAAYGEDVDRGSFVVVRGCPGEPLDDLLRAGTTPAERRVLARQSAEIFSRMRAARLRHRDAYACHLFVERLPSGADGLPRFDMRLIDLTRAGRAPHPRARWYVKDAAQLWHGVPHEHISRTDAVRWLRAYFGLRRLDWRAKRFARRVAAKEGRIRRRQERKARARAAE